MAIWREGTMSHVIKWNKTRTRVAIYSTVADGLLTQYFKPENLLKYYPGYSDTILPQIYGKCSCCGQELTDEHKKKIQDYVERFNS